MWMTALLTSALGSPHLATDHQGQVVTEVRPTAEQRARLFDGAEATGTYDGVEHVTVYALPATTIGDLSVGQQLRGGDEASPHTCTVRGFVMEAALRNRPPSDTTDRHVLATLECTAQQGVRWLFDPDAPWPHRPATTPATGPTPLLDDHPDQQRGLADFTARADGREVHQERTVASFTTIDGVPHRLVSGRWYTGEGVTDCEGEDMLETWAAVIRDAPTPSVLAFQRHSGKLYGVLDVDRDGTVELVVSYGTGAAILTLDGTPIAQGSDDFWPFCEC